MIIRFDYHYDYRIQFISEGGVTVTSSLILIVILIVWLWVTLTVTVLS